MSAVVHPLGLSYWLDTAPAFTGAVEGSVAGQYDVCVVGAGFTGLSAALYLARTGAKVVVVEAGDVMGAASGRNGGQCNAGTAHDYGALANRLGKDQAKAMYHAYAASVDTVEAMVRDEAIDCDFNRCGRLKLAAKPEHFQKLEKAYERLIVDGVDRHVKLVQPADMASEIGSTQFHGGLVQTTGAQLHVGRFGRGLADRAVSAGAQIFDQCAVSAIRRLSDAKFEVTSQRGTFEAAHILLATGGTGPSSSKLGPFQYFRKRIVPVGSFIIATEPLSEAVLDQIVPTRRNYVTSKNVGNYFRVSPDNRLIFGGRARFAMSSPRSDAKSGEVLKRAMTDIFPQLTDTRIEYCWGGQVDMTEDRLPRAGTHEGMSFAMGYSGHGVQMSVHMGQVMGAKIAGREAENPWDLNWPSIPFYTGRPWFLPVVGAYYKLQDILH
jgi:glycine/D-amino acid oxidase-like deaminating enzyme